MKTIYLYKSKTNELLTINVSGSINYKQSEEYRNALYEGAQVIKLNKFFGLKIFEDEFEYSSSKTKFVRTKNFISVIDSSNFIVSKNLYGYKSNMRFFKYFENYIEGYNYGKYFEFVFTCDEEYFGNEILEKVEILNEDFLFKNKKIRVLENFNDFLEFNSDFYNKVRHLVEEHARFLSNNHMNNNAL